MEITFEANGEYTDQVFRRAAYAQERVSHVTFDNCQFIGCIFQEARLENCKFRDCTFQDCDLRLMHVPGSSFRNTRFEQCKVIGVNWTEGSWAKSGLLDSIGFSGCDVSHSTFIGLNLKAMALTRCAAKNADFAEADLTRADFTATDFVESRFLHTNLTEANFTGAQNYAIDVSLNTVKKAKFSLPEAINLLRCMDIELGE
ncbi:MAG TPA: pentapeptide repeat-containing protein [Aggregatilineales bacterium]|nr:pentapeptide repeat-containing protein [Aggregatilineales bacterium]